jgi:hypothetical protein
LEKRLVYEFLKEETPSDVVWLRGGEQLAVLTHREGKVSVMLTIDVTSGNKVELYDVGFSSGEFDIEPTTGKLVLTSNALSLEGNPNPEGMADTLIIPGGYDFRWRHRGDQVLFKARRYPGDFIESLKRGRAPSDDRLFILVDGGFIESKDPDDKYSLYVRDVSSRENNKQIGEFVSMTLQEAQEFAAKHIPSLTLESDGPKFTSDREGKVPK